MTEKVVYAEHTERAVVVKSAYVTNYMKTIPELCVEEIIIYNLEALPCGIRYRL